MRNLMRSLRFLAVLFSIIGFLDFNTAVAHTDMPHTDATLTSTVADVEGNGSNLDNFVKHAAMHLSEARHFEEVLELLNEFRNEEGEWNDGSRYLILLTRGGGVYVHPGGRELEDQDWSERLSGCSGEIWHELVESGGGCVKVKGQNGENGYAFSFAAPYVPFANPYSREKDFVLIGGLDYRPRIDPPGSFEEMTDDLVNSYLRRLGVDLDSPEASDLRREGRDLFLKVVTPEVDSSEVRNEVDLMRFLDGAFKTLTSFLGISSRGTTLFDSVILRRVYRFEGGPWKNVSTYIYIMDERGNVIFNGANRKIEQTNLWNFPEDSDDKFIQRIIEAAKRPGGGFVLYDWDNPEVQGDEPAGGGAGGSSPKLGYARQLVLDKDESEKNPRIYIFGTGLYIGSQAQPAADSGCAIAGRGKSLGSAAVNLLLVVFSVFCIAFIRHAGRLES